MRRVIWAAACIVVGIISTLAFVLWVSIEKAGSEAAAAWVQAVGAIVGLVVAIGVPAWLKVQESRKELVASRRKATSLVVTILPSIDVWANNVRDLVEGCLRAKRGEVDYASVSKDVRSIVDIPGPLHSRLDVLHELGDMAIDIQKAVLRQRWLFDNAKLFYISSIMKETYDQNGMFALTISSEDRRFLERWVDTLSALSKDLNHAQGVLRKWLGDKVDFEIPLLGAGN